MAVAEAVLDSAAALPLVRQLFSRLAENRISYCHWKSNATLAAALRGETDLDLLVARHDASRFVQLIMQLGFKLAETPGEARLPGIHHYYGYDAEAEFLVHVHAHSLLIVGDDMAKNYRLPVERALLASASEEQGINVSAPEFEYVLLVLRLVLKHCSLDSILCLSGKIRRSERAELEYLEARIDWARVGEIIARELPCVGVNLFEKCVAALHRRCRVWKKVAVAHKLHQQLRVWGRRSESRNATLKVWRRAVRLFSRIIKSRRKKQLASGGAIIALIGGDGAGKTTAVRGMADWLSRDFETATFHLGKPPWSLTTYVVRGTAKLLRCLAEALRSNAACEPAAPPGRLPGHLDLLRNLCTARDRFRLYLRARRHANNGAISICDRFPLPQIRLMDGTRIPDAAAMVAANRLKRWMVRAETKYYEAIAAPELLFVLKIDPARAAARKPDEEASFVIARCQEIWDFDWSASSAHVVDGSRPAQQVLATIKYATWQSL